MAQLLQFATRAQYTVTWFWKNDLEEWIKYGDQGLDPKYSSEKIEEAFQRGDKVFDFQHGYHYRIDFEVMKQVNRSTGTRRDTKREITIPAQCSDSHLQQNLTESLIRENTVTWPCRDESQECNKNGEQELDPNITSQRIEEAFQNGNNEFCFHHEFPYRTHFKDMKQVNGTTGTRRDTKRETSVAIPDFSSSSGGSLESVEAVEEEKEGLSVQNAHSERSVTWSWQNIDGLWIKYNITGTDGGITSEANENDFQTKQKKIIDRKLNSFRIPTRRNAWRKYHPPNQPRGSENPSEKLFPLLFIPPNSDRSQVSIDGSQGTDGGITSEANGNDYQTKQEKIGIDLGQFKSIKELVADMEQINLRTQTRRDIKRENNASNQPRGSENLSEKESTLESNIPPNSDLSQASINGSQGTGGGITSGANGNDFQTKQEKIGVDLERFGTIRKLAERKKNNIRIQTRQDIVRENNASNQPSGSENLSEELFTLPFIPPNSDRSQVSIDGSQRTDGGITSGASGNAVQPQKKEIVFDLWRFKSSRKLAGRKKNSFRIPTRRDVKRADHPPHQPSGSENPSEEKSTPELNIPPNWDHSQASIDGFQLVPLGQQHSEYSMVQKLFAATMNTTIKNVYRIQNVELWENFTRKTKWMSLKNEGQAEEWFLFHGTSSSSITGICKMNFDLRLHGKHGAVYGKGVYFAKNATYSDRYVTEAQSSKQMILARVLVGEFVQGNETYCRPPEKAPTVLYDSCVDDISNPEIFVIFEKDQMYPAYLLEYEKE